MKTIDDAVKVQDPRLAVLLMTGHSLTLLIDGDAVAGGRPNKRSVANLKRYIAARRGTIRFSEDNMNTFPWLRDLINL